MKPYSHDLRVRILEYSLTHTAKETARIFQVGINTVFLLKKLFYEEGNLNPRVNNNKYYHLITPDGEIYLECLISEENDLTLDELRDRYEAAYNVRVSIGTMHNTLRHLNITRKKSPFLIQRKIQIKLN